LDVTSLSATGTGRSRAATLGLFVAATALACTEFEPGSDTLGFTGDIDSLEPAPPGKDWRCLDETVVTPSAPIFAGVARPVIYSLQMVDLSSGAIYRSIQVRACSLTDVSCSNPLTDMLTVNEQGRVDVPLFENFTGYLEITSDELVPQLFYLTQPLQPQTAPEFPLAMVAVTNLVPLVQLLGVDLQPNMGLIALRIFDCKADTAAGVSLSTEQRGAVPWYFVGGLPSSSQTETGPEGLAGFMNVAPGLAVFEATNDEGALLGGLQSVVVRPGWMSSMYLRPPGVQTSAR
jgi:hypothetical protein